MTKLEATVKGCEAAWGFPLEPIGSDPRLDCHQAVTKILHRAVPSLLLLLLMGCSTATGALTLELTSGTLPQAAHSEGLSYPRVPASAAAIAELLSEIEPAVRSPSTSQAVMERLGHQQQLIYRYLGRDRELAKAVRRLLSLRWQRVLDHHLGARRALEAMARRRSRPTTLPAWRIVAPEPAANLLRYYRKAAQATGIPWEVLAAVNLVETGMGRIDGVSSADARGPMQFLPSTWAERGIGQGNIRDPHDAIQAAARYLVRRGGLQNIRRGLWGYNNSDDYGTAVLHYAALLKMDPLAYQGLYHWQIHLLTAAGDVWLPVGTQHRERVPVQRHLQQYPWSLP